jgi:two-component system nitrate/nitrite response regulator NarL
VRAVTYTVIVSDAHALYREGLVQIINKWKDFEVVSEAEDNMRAVELCKKHKPDIVLLDVGISSAECIEATREISQGCPDTSTVLLAMYLSKEDLVSAIANGACGYLLKNIKSHSLEERLKEVAQGNKVLAPEATTLCFKIIRRYQYGGKMSDPALSKTQEKLTDHERELLRQVALGCSNREISKRMYLGESTIKKQVSNLLVKLNLNNRTQAAVFALRAGLID